MKNLEWLKEETIKLNNMAKENLSKDTLRYVEGVFDGTRDILTMINEVEQSMVSKDEFNKLYDAFQELSNKHDELIMRQLAMQEMPKYITDYIEEMKSSGRSLYQAISLIMSYGWDDKKHIHYKIHKWIIDGDNEELFAKKWLEVSEKKEEKYKVLIGVASNDTGLFLCKGPYSGKVSTGSNLRYFHSEANNNETYLTEREIKEFKDGIYWAFAEPVKEKE